MANRIVVTTNGKETSGYSCPLKTVNGCSIKNIDCKFGVTEIAVPKECPLREGKVETIIEVEALNKSETLP